MSQTQTKMETLERICDGCGASETVVLIDGVSDPATSIEWKMPWKGFVIQTTPTPPTITLLDVCSRACFDIVCARTWAVL